MTSVFNRLSHRPIVAGLAGLAAVGLLAACSSTTSSSAAASGSSSSGQTSAASGVAVTTRTVSGVGTVLSNPAGLTLYSPTQEASGVIKCTGECNSFWFPVTVAKGATPKAASTLTGKLGTFQRPSGGGTQLTYDGKPLYTFKLDTAAGQTNGNGYKDQFGSLSFNWNAITTSGAGATVSSGGSGTSGGQPASTPSYSYGGGGY